MALKAAAQAMLAIIITQHPEAVASVVANGETADGVKDTSNNVAELTDDGEVGVNTRTIRCNADTLVASSLTRGQTITVAAVSVFVMDFRIDPEGAIVTIDYSTQRPVT